MKIAVASHNPVKIAATRAAFAVLFPDQDLDVQPLSVPSGVSDQPMSDAETRQGARNRARQALAMSPEADFAVGLEGGLDEFDGQLMASAWMAVAHPDGRIGEARSATLPLPPSVQALVHEGLELGEANDRIFNTRNSKQAGGAYGLLTAGRYTRASIYTQTLELALIPFVHSAWAAEAPH